MCLDVKPLSQGHEEEEQRTLRCVCVSPVTESTNLCDLLFVSHCWVLNEFSRGRKFDLKPQSLLTKKDEKG
uniref:Uncharacterized protein n=1 Tax=Anguilla anguilla TaxID=7936 RepID=A0A0E9TDZ4_ANGAN